MRGEDIGILPLRSCAAGLSPHARGRPDVQLSCMCQYRFIPACAGSTNSPCFILGYFQVHPRIRGADSPRTYSALQQRGSSPHTRGLLISERTRVNPERCIPACAGVYLKDSLVSFIIAGTSPHARGRHIQSFIAIFLHGFIPAYAGSTYQLGQRALLFEVHPRIRGVDDTWYYLVLVDWGASPHARGRRSCKCFYALSIGFIPAQAGRGL